VKRVLLGTFLCLLILVAVLALASRWPALFWLLVICFCLYMLLGRKAEVEVKLGIGGGDERRIYAALTWKRRAGVGESAGANESSGLEAVSAGRDE